MKNKTAKDAYERIAQARIGSSVDASPDYLGKMHTLLLQWADECKAMLLVGAAHEAMQAAENEDERSLN